MSLSTEQLLLIEQRLTNEKKSTTAAYLLWFFLGMWGGHRFYLGRFFTGLIQLALLGIGFVTSFILIGYPILFVLGVWVVIDAFLIPGMIREDSAAKRDAIIRSLY